MVVAVAEDLRQRYAEAIAAKFTEPVYRSDRDGSNERVENAEPADRIDQAPYVMVTAGDGCRSFWTPTCDELAEVVAAVRDEELERLRAEIARVEAVHRVHHCDDGHVLSRTPTPCLNNGMCSCGVPADRCRTRAALKPETPPVPEEEI